MRRLASKIGSFLKPRQNANRFRTTKSILRRRLELEFLEDRCVPTATASGVITGVAYADSTGTGVFNSNDAKLPGINLTLTGRTILGNLVNTTATTDANGAFIINNVLPGTYAVSGTGGSVILGSPSIGGLSVAGGQTVTQNVGFRGLAPDLITMRLFLASSTSADLPLGQGGSGTGVANFRPDNAPVVIIPIADMPSVSKNSPQTTIDLANHITDPDLTFKIDTTDGPINVRLFASQAPKTVLNFLNYALSGAYNNSIFHRLVTGFVLQGGGFTFDANSHSLPAISANLAVKNEFGISNTKGTLGMALTGSDINSATDEFFFNLADNSSSLDPQKFTVFGQIVGAADQAVIDKLAATPINTKQSAPFDTIPLNSYTGTNFPTDATAANFIQINDVVAVNDANETLTYSVVSSDSSLVTAKIDTNDKTQLDLNYASGQTGKAVITVTATDLYGAKVTDSFTVTVVDKGPTATVALNTSSPLATDTLTATATASDPDGEPVTLTYQWQINGSTVPTTTNTLNLTGIAKPGDSVIVNVTPNDGNMDGPVVNATATVATPSAGSVTLPADPATTATITATLSGSHATSFTYVWSVNGATVQTDNTSAVTDTLNQTVNTGNQVTVQVTPTDGVNTGTPKSASTTVNVPQVASVALTPMTPATTDTVTATVSSPNDPNGDPITLTYVWKVNNNVVQTTSNTSSLTDMLNLGAISGVMVQHGDTVSVQVTPSNATISGTPANSSVTVA